MASPTNGDLTLTSQQRLECLITNLQAKQKVFPVRFYWRPFSPSAAEILDLMNMYLGKVIRKDLIGIYMTDKVFGEFLCHVFFRKRTHIDDEDIHVPSKNKGEMWQKTKLPLYCLLVAAYVSNAMAHTYSDQEEFRQDHEYYESIAWSFFDEMYQNNKKNLEYHVLAYDYESFYKKSVAGSVKNNLNMSEDVEKFQSGLMNEKDKLVREDQKRINKQWEKSSRELLCVAYRGQCMKFISHVACQNYIKTRWEDGKVDKLFKDESSSRPSLVAYLTTFFPLRTPQKKYRTHMLCNLVFIVFFAMALLKKPWKQLFSLDPKGGTFNFWWTVPFFYVLVSLILELIVEQILKAFVKTFFLQKKRGKWRKAYWWADDQGRLLRAGPFIANCFLFYLAAVFQIYPSIFFPVCEILFIVSFILSTIKILNYFSFSNYFGPKIQLIREMTKSIFMYMAILVVFWITYVVSYLSLTEGISTNQESLWQLFQNGVFEILGESRDEDRDGIISKCSDVRWGSVDFEKPDQVSCLFRSSMIPALLFIYMMTATIMLINIFTAMLSHKYEVSNQDAANYSRFQKYETLARFESKNFFPRPLNIIYIVGWIFYKIGKYYILCGCCKDHSDESPFVISWFSSVKSWGSGPKDARVKKKEVEDLLKQQRETNDFVDAVQKLITAWKPTHRNPESSGQDRIEEAHKVLEGVIGKFKDFLLTETERVRRRWEDPPSSYSLSFHTALEEIRRLTGDVLQRVRNRSGATGRERAATNP